MIQHTKSNRFDDQGISKQSKSLTYIVLEHEEHENSHLPISPNLLTFRDKELNSKYLKTIYCHSDDSLLVSPDFKNTLLFFYLFYTLYLVVILTFSLLLHSDGKYSDQQLFYHISCCACLLTFAYMLLLSTLKSHWILMRNRHYYFVLGIVTIIYLIIGDDRVLSEILDTDYKESRFPTIAIISCFIVMMRNLLAECFYYITLLSILSLILFLSLNLGYSSLSVYSTLFEFSILFVFLVLQIFESQQTDFRTRQLFWRKTREEKAFEKKENEQESNSKVKIKTEIEVLVHICDDIKQDIKYAHSVIMFNDVKERLKRAQYALERVKKRIGHGSFLMEVKIEADSNIDEQDKAFIKENFMEVTHESTTVINRGARRTTMSDIDEKEPPFPFSNYGVAELEGVLYSVGKNWNFDVWFIYDATGHSIHIVAKYLLQKWGLGESYSISEETSDKFFQTVEKTYQNNPYHNACHGADVLHTLLYFYFQSDFLKNLNTIDTLASIVAATGHDVGHPGVTNRFLVNNRHEIALKYNDNSVLENMHCSEIYSIMGKHGCNIFEHLSSDDWIKARKLIIEMVLETDMSRHFEILGRFRTRCLNFSDLNMEVQDDKVLVLSMGLKCADIGHSAKIPILHEKWTRLVCEEFFKQGDVERSRNQPISMYCDRENADIPKSQAGFIKNICIPLFEVWCQFLKSELINKTVLDQLTQNQAMWEEKSKTKHSSVVGVGGLVVQSLTKDFSEVISLGKVMKSADDVGARPAV